MSLSLNLHSINSTLNQGPVSLTVADKIKRFNLLRETPNENKLTVIAKRAARFVATFFATFPAAFVGMVYHGYKGISLTLYPERMFPLSSKEQHNLRSREINHAVVDATICWAPGSELFVALINSLYSNSLVATQS